MFISHQNLVTASLFLIGHLSKSFLLLKLLPLSTGTEELTFFGQMFNITSDYRD